MNRFSNGKWHQCECPHWCHFPFEKSTVQQTGELTIDTRNPLEISFCWCLSAACCRKSWISLYTVMYSICVEWPGFHYIFCFVFLNVWCTVCICSTAEMTNYSIRTIKHYKNLWLDDEWCCDVVYFLSVQPVAGLEIYFIPTIIQSIEQVIFQSSFIFSLFLERYIALWTN